MSGAHGGGPGRAFELPCLGRLLRHAAPRLLEATVVPLVLFYASLWLVGLGAALVTALAWSYGAVVWRLATGRRVTGLLLLGTAGLTVRTLLALAAHSAFVYFLQPTLGTVVTAAAFFASVAVGRPLFGRLALDVVPVPDRVLERPWIPAFFDRQSVLWGAVHVANAGVTLWLLLTQPLATFVVAKTVVGWSLSGSAFAWSVTSFRHQLARDGETTIEPGLPVPVPLPA